MSEKPIQFKLTTLEPVDSVVQILRHWLAEAKTGKLRGVILLGVEGRGDHIRASKGEIGDATAILLAQLVIADGIDAARAREGQIEFPDLDDDDEPTDDEPTKE